LTLAVAAPQVSAADLENPYLKAPPKGELNLFVEGGAYWTEGDPVYAPWGFAPNIFELKPNVGWVAAGGFDYRFAASPWHVSMDFRYGQARSSANGSNSEAFFAAAVVPGGGIGYALSDTESANATHKETYALADFAVGRDVLGFGPDAMQVKLGIRVADLTATTNINSNLKAAFAVVAAGGGFIGGYVGLANNQQSIEQKSTYLGVGPRLGISGSVPIYGMWSLDYLGDVAVLEGEENFSRLDTSKTTALVAAGGPGFLLLEGFTLGSTFGSSASQEATVANADFQVGFSYHFLPNAKVTASYRLDVFSQAMLTMNPAASVANLTKVGRYDQGPLLGVTSTW
jgi:hypothetical protein